MSHYCVARFIWNKMERSVDVVRLGNLQAGIIVVNGESGMLDVTGQIKVNFYWHVGVVRPLEEW